MRRDRAAWLAGSAAAIAAGLLGALLGGWFHIGVSAVLAGCMTMIAVEDARRFRVPDSWNLLAALVGLVVVWIEAGAGLPDALPAVGRAALQAVICGGAFYLVREVYFRLRGVEGLGLGDVKLAATAGIWLGWQLLAVTVTLAALAALLWVAAQTVANRGWHAGRKIPLGAFLAPAIWVCWYAARLVADALLA